VRQELSQYQYGSPEYQDDRKHLSACEAEAEKQKKEHFANTAATWATSLDSLPNGGWGLLQVSNDGTMAVFGSRRHEMRAGNVVSLWFRYEFRETQGVGAEQHKSAVQREMYDCARMSVRVVSVSFFGANNLAVPGSSSTYDESKASWTPLIPGTMGDYLLDWACKTTAPKPKPAS
jgi:hypothetical protein